MKILEIFNPVARKRERLTQRVICAVKQNPRWIKPQSDAEYWAELGCNFYPGSPTLKQGVTNDHTY